MSQRLRQSGAISTFAVRHKKFKHLGEVLFEFQRFGNALKVCAVDPKSGVEISIQGPLTGSREDLKMIAMAKLDYVLRKRAEGQA